MRTRKTMRKLLSTALALVFLLALLPVGAQAAEIVESGSCGNGLTWTLDNEGTLTISGSGKIDDYGLQGLGMQRVYIPSTVTGVGIAAFVDNDDLAEIIVAEDSAYLCSVDGVLFTADMKTLISYPGGKQDTEYTVPNGVKTIAKDAFNYVSALEHLILPDGLEIIRNYGFIGNSSLQSIVIPDSVSIIEYMTFNGCDSLTDVYYDGDLTSWLRIDVGNNNDVLNQATIHFNPESAGEGYIDYGFSGSGLGWALDGNGILSLFGSGLLGYDGMPWFDHINEITDFRIAEDNVYYCAMDTALYTLDCSELIAYSGGNGRSSYTIPEGVTRIGNYAFQNAGSLRQITIPLSMHGIGWGAFSGCMLDTVSYAGSSEDWEQIFIDGENGSLTFAYYREPGLYWRTAIRDWDPELQWSWHSTADEPNRELNGVYSTGWSVEFLLRDEDGILTSVDVADLELPEQILTVNTEEGAFCNIHAAGIGSGVIRYDDYSIPVNIQFPKIGFYSAPTASIDTWIGTWDYTGSNDTIYLISMDQEIVNAECIDGDPVDVSVGGDGRTVTVHITDIQNEWTEICVTLAGEDGNEWEEYYSIDINDLRPGLVWRWAFRGLNEETGAIIWNESDQTPTRGALNSRALDRYTYQFLWRNEDGSLDPVNVADLTIPDFVRTESVEGSFAVLFLQDLGSGYIEYRGERLQVSAEYLPTFGFYSEPEVREDTWLRAWGYNGENNTVYLVFPEGVIYTAEQLYGCDVDVTVSDTGKYVTVNLLDPNSSFVQLKLTGMWDDGRTFDPRYVSISFNDMRPGLVWRWAKRVRDEETGTDIWVEQSDVPTRTALDGRALDTHWYQFLWRNEDGTLEPVNVADLSIPDFIRTDNVDGSFAALFLQDLGSGYIEYRGERLQVSAEHLPTFGFYTEPDAREDTWLRAWDYTGENDTVYLVYPEGVIYTAEQLYGCDVAVTVSDTGKYVTVKLLDPNSSFVQLKLTGLWADGNAFDQWYVSIAFNDMQPGLVWVYARSEWDAVNQTVVYSNYDWATPSHGNIVLQRGYGSILQFLWRETDGSLTPVNAEDLVLPEHMTVTNIDGSYGCLWYDSWGTGEISYNGSILNVVSVLPDLGYYSEPVPSEETWIGKWEYTGENKTIYLVPKEGILDEVELQSGSSAEVTLSDDGTYASITVAVPSNGWIEVSCSGRYLSGGIFSNFWKRIELINLSPVPVLSDATASAGQITVTWNAVNGATKYAVYRKTAGGNWTLLTTSVTDTTYADTSSLVAGTTYYYTVKSLLNGRWSGYDAVGVSAVASSIPVLESAAASAGQITVKWHTVNGATKYAVYRKTAGGNWTLLTTSVTDTTYTDKSADLTAGTTYYYTVKSLVNGTWSNCDGRGVSATAASTTPVLVSAAASAGQITVKWNAVSNASKYAVYRKTAGGNWTLLTTSVTGTTYTDKSADLTAGTTYYYTVKSLVNENWSGYDAVGVNATAASTTPVLVSAAASAGQITVKWNAVSNASKYAVYRKTAGGNWTLLTTAVTDTTYADTSSLAAGTTYYYTVKALVNETWSGYDAVGVNATTASTTPVLASATATSGQITVKWDEVSGASKYAVYRKTASSSWTLLTTSVTGPSYVDKSSELVAGTVYYYTVKSLVSGAWSGYDAKGVSATAVASSSASTTPVLVSAAASAGQITVKWNAVNGASKYAVYRKTASSSWTLLTTSVTGPSYVDKSSELVAGTVYYYTVKSLVSGAWSGYDAKGVSATAVASSSASTTPVLVSAAASAGQITVKWDEVSGASKYAVYRKTASSSWTLLTTSVTGPSYVDKSSELVAGTVYYYTVKSLVSGAWSGYDAKGVSATAK